MGSETMGSLVMAQISAQAEIILGGWDVICPSQDDWGDSLKSSDPTKECDK